MDFFLFLDLNFILLGHESIAAKVGDALPKNICQECLKNLTAAVKFVRECVEAQKKLRESCRSTKLEKGSPTQAKTKKSLLRRRSNRVKTEESSVPVVEIVELLGPDLELKEEQLEDEMRHSSDDDRPDEQSAPVLKESVQKFVVSENLLNPSSTTLVHDKNYQCSYCQRAFNNKFRLKNHLRIHTGERPFTCKTCNKSFAQPNALKCHIRLHTGEKPYKCPVESCGKTFTQNTTLKTHMAALHIGKMVKCDKCDKAFTRASYLTAHKRLEHLGQRPYACHICPNRYKQKSHLDHHLEVHQGVKYTCLICNRKYSKKWSLQVHSFTHRKDGDKDTKLPHACTECEKSFAEHGNGPKKVTKVKVVPRESQEEVPAPSNVVEVESRPIILQEAAIEGLKDFEGTQYHVINITEGSELIQEIVIPNGAIFLSG